MLVECERATSFYTRHALGMSEAYMRLATAVRDVHVHANSHTILALGEMYI